MRMLIEAREEQAALTRGVPDAIDRLQRLRDRIEDLDPYYQLDIHVTTEGTEVRVRPRYRGAERDRPILITGQMTFPDTPLGQEIAQKYQAVFDYGDKVTIPAEFHQGHAHRRARGDGW